MWAGPRAEDFRIAGGTLYNIQLSTNWVRLSQAKPLYVVAVRREGLLVEERWEDPVYGPPQVNALERIGAGFGGGPPHRPLLYTIKQTGLRKLIRNYPKGVVTGSRVPSDIFMPSGTMDWEGSTIAIVDYGLPNTPENRKTLKEKPPTISTGITAKPQQGSGQPAPR